MGRALHTVQGTYIQVQLQTAQVVFTVLKALQQNNIIGNRVTLDFTLQRY